MTFRNFRYALEFAPVWVADRLVSALPRSSAVKLGEALGTAMSVFLPGRSRLMRANLERSLPEKSPAERENIRRQVWKNLGRVAAEFIHASGINRNNFPQHFEVENKELLERAKQKGKGIILVGFHFTNWELTGVACKLLDDAVVAIARPIKNPLVDRWVQRKRGQGGMDIILHRSAVRGALKILKAKGTIGILVDQNLYTGGVFAEFLGRPAATTTLPALLHSRTDAPVLLVYCLRAKNKFRLIYEEMDDVRFSSGGDDSLLAMTSAINRRLGEIIRAYPENWFWVHNRWKRQPES